MTAWRSLLRAHATVVRRLDAELASDHMPLSEYEILANLSEAPDRALRMSELAELVMLTPSGLTRAVDRLVVVGRVERRSCPEDARGTYAALTDDGFRALVAAYPLHLEGVRRHVVDRIHPADLATFARVLQALAAEVQPR